MQQDLFIPIKFKQYMNETKTKTCFDKQEREKIDDKNDDMQNLKEWHCNADVIDKKINKVYEFVEVSFFWLFHLAIPMSRFISLKQKKRDLMTMS